MEKKSKEKTRERRQQLLDLINKNPVRLYLGMLCMIIVAATTALMAYLLKPVIDDIFINQDKSMLIKIPFFLFIVFVLRGIATFGSEYLVSYVGESVIRRLRNRLYEHISYLSLSFFHEKKTGVLMSRVTNDVSIIKQMVSSAVINTMRDFFKVLFFIGLILYHVILDNLWDLAFFTFVVLPLAYYPILVFGRLSRKVSTKSQESMAEINTHLHETFSGNKIVKAFSREDYEIERFHIKALNLFKFELKTVMARALMSPVMETLGGIGVALVVWFGGSRVIEGTCSAGTFVSFIAAVLMMYEPVKQLSRLNSIIQQGLAATDRVFDILEKNTDIREVKEPVIIEHGPHSVTFQDVSFSYGEEMVLENINLDVKAGEVVALAGMSGGGKSSLVNLIPRFYDVRSGRLLIDGIDVRDASLASLRDQIAIVTQEPILFNDTVRNNIAYGNPNASEEDIFEAAKAAFAYDFIQGFPKGFDTMIGELGSRLSGGEKQRMCIARAILKNAPILILDEATSSLDAEAEQLVQKALENLMKGRTTFVIAHRLSTIGYADRILVIVDGRIVEEGKHEDLLERKGEYYKLFQMQFENGQGGQKIDN